MLRDFERDVGAARGLVTTAQLRALGYTNRNLAALVRDGRAVRPRRGWIAAPDALPQAVRAVELGGRLGGASALVTYGIWIDDPTDVIVTCRPTAARLPAPTEETRLWVPDRFPVESSCRWRVSALDALLQYSRSASRNAVIASVDSALQHRVVTKREVGELASWLPARKRSLVREVDGAAMSGTETRMRLALKRAGFRVESQAEIPGVGAVDLLVDGWLIVELDSREHHQSENQQVRDRERDGNAVLLGLGHERFMWGQVRNSIEWCVEVVAARLREGRPQARLSDRSRPRGTPQGLLFEARGARGS